MDNETKSPFKYTECSVDVNDPVVKIYELYINSSHPKLRAAGCVFFAQRLLRESSPDYQEAIILWKRALTLSQFTNTIALYNLAVHHYLGKGVGRDYEKAFALFEKAGHSGNYLYGCRNFGVKEASFAAGKCLENGTGHAKDIRKAGEWYYESYRCDYGYGPAGLQYASLCRSGLLDVVDPEFKAQRFMDSTSMWGIAPSLSVDFLVDFQNPLPNIIHQSHSSNSKYWVHEKEIRLKAEAAKHGFAANLRYSMNEFAQGLYAMSCYFDAEPEKAHREKEDIVQQEIIHHIANAFRCTEDVSICREDNWKKFQALIEANVSPAVNDTPIFPSPFDRDVRICKLMEIITSPMPPENPIEELAKFFAFLKESKAKYPTELFFHQLSISMASKDEVKFGDDAGLDLESTLKIFPNHPDILYLRGVLIGNRSVDQLTKENAYLDFIKTAPEDHKDVPDALYRLSALNGKSNNVEQCLIYYEKGIQAEKNLLSFYLPYASVAKQDVRKMISTQ